MSNDRNNATTNNQTKNPNPYDPANVVTGLRTTSVPLNDYGHMWKETCTSLQEKIVNRVFVEDLQLPEIDRVLIYPVIERDRTVSDILCFAYFDTASKDAKHITRKSSQISTVPGRQTVMDSDPVRYDGDFNKDDHFIAMIAPLTDLDENGDIIVKSAQADPSMAIVELNFWLVGALLLHIMEDDPYNFTVLHVEQTGVRRKDNDKLEDSVICLAKYIDYGNRRSKSRSNNGRRIDYRSMDADLINQRLGRNNNGNNGGGRRF